MQRRLFLKCPVFREAVPYDVQNPTSMNLTADSNSELGEMAMIELSPRDDITPLSIIEINNGQGDLTDVLAETKSLIYHRFISLRVVGSLFVVAEITDRSTRILFIYVIEKVHNCGIKVHQKIVSFILNPNHWL